MKEYGWTLFWLAPIILLPTWVLWVFTMLFSYDYPPPYAQGIYWLAGLVAIPIFGAIAMTGGWLLAHHNGGRRARLSIGLAMLFASAAIFIFIIFIDYIRNWPIFPFAVPLLYFILVLIGGLCLIVPGSSKKPSRVDTQPLDEPEEIEQ
jgi:hypothetical protein